VVKTEKLTWPKIEELGRKFNTASFAVWGVKEKKLEKSKQLEDFWSKSSKQGEFIGEEVIRKHLKDLKRNVIFLGLNPSDDVEPFQNFHWREEDKNRPTSDKKYKRSVKSSRGALFKLKKIIAPSYEKRLENLYGAYMTDITNYVGDGDTALCYIHNNRKKCREYLENQLKSLGEDSYTLIVFGEKALTALGYINVSAIKKNIKIYPLPHYSASILLKDLINRFRYIDRELELLNKKK
jgi:hypothetical protein